MDSDGLSLFLKRNIVSIAIGIIGVLLLLTGVFQFLSYSKPSETELVFQEGDEEEEIVEIIVDVEGAVIEPGVYKLSSEKRIVDALAVAGGLNSEADRDWVEKNINLAGKLSDGLKIYIPRVGEEILSEATTAQAAGPVLNINLATTADLESLPGVGVVTAKKIIDGRPYSKSEELLSKKIVGAATYEKIKDKISAN